MNGVRKAAILLVAVGENLAKEVLRALPEPDVQRLTEELADLRGITPELSAEVMEEFWELLETQNFMIHGGLDYASRLLVDTFGKERAEDLLMQVRRSQEEANGDLARAGPAERYICRSFAAKLRVGSRARLGGRPRGGTRSV